MKKIAAQYLVTLHVEADVDPAHNLESIAAEMVGEMPLELFDAMSIVTRYVHENYAVATVEIAEPAIRTYLRALARRVTTMAWTDETIEREIDRVLAEAR